MHLRIFPGGVAAAEAVAVAVAVTVAVAVAVAGGTKYRKHLEWPPNKLHGLSAPKEIPKLTCVLLRPNAYFSEESSEVWSAHLSERTGAPRKFSQGGIWPTRNTHS